MCARSSAAEANNYVLAIDQGTTSTRAILFDRRYRTVATAQQEFTQHYPASGWVEHDPEDIWRTVVSTCKEVIERSGATAAQIASLGISNQRETVVVWDRDTGRPLHNAIVWQDRRTAEECERMKARGEEAEIRQITGLLCDPYLSATKIAWILNRLPGAKLKAQQGKLAVGTVDTFLLWRLTEGKVYATDATNASRTMLYDIRKGAWSDKLRERFEVPEAALPRVLDCAADFGVTHLFGGGIRIGGVAGDQHAALIGQACFRPGMMKATYGTGCFVLMNTGAEPIFSGNKLLTTIAYRLAGETRYALEGSIFAAGSVVQWLRDGLGIIDSAKDADKLASQADPAGRVYLVPAFTGLGAPYWNPDCRGAIYGLTRGTSAADIAKAALESVAWQTRDLVEAFRRDCSIAMSGELRVDGGMASSDLTMQGLADVLRTTVARPAVLETSALGAAYLAGLQCGYYPAPSNFAKTWQADTRFTPRADREDRYKDWLAAVQSTLKAPPADSRTP